MRKIYIFTGIILSIALAILAVGYYFSAENGFYQNISLNLISEVVGIIITVFFIDRIIRVKEANDQVILVEKEKKEKINKEQTALKRLYYPLYRQVNLFKDMLSELAEYDGSYRFETFQSLLDPSKYTKINQADFEGKVKFIKDINVTWNQRISADFLYFRDELGSILYKYPWEFGKDGTEAIEEILECGFIIYLQRNRVYSNFIFSPEVIEILLCSGYLPNLSRLIEYYNDNILDKSKKISPTGV